jgi:hypothetical protein
MASYFNKNPQQIYTTLYLKIKPLTDVNIPDVKVEEEVIEEETVIQDDNPNANTNNALTDLLVPQLIIEEQQIVNQVEIPEVIQKLLNLGYELSEKANELINNPDKGYKSLINVLVKHNVLNKEREFNNLVSFNILNNSSMLVQNKDVIPPTTRLKQTNNNQEELKEIIKRC